jgi:hypothetical protein
VDFGFAAPRVLVPPALARAAVPLALLAVALAPDFALLDAALAFAAGLALLDALLAAVDGFARVAFAFPAAGLALLDAVLAFAAGLALLDALLAAVDGFARVDTALGFAADLALPDVLFTARPALAAVLLAALDAVRAFPAGLALLETARVLPVGLARLETALALLAEPFADPAALLADAGLARAEPDFLTAPLLLACAVLARPPAEAFATGRTARWATPLLFARAPLLDPERLLLEADFAPALARELRGLLLVRDLVATPPVGMVPPPFAGLGRGNATENTQNARSS